MYEVRMNPQLWMKWIESLTSLFFPVTQYITTNRDARILKFWVRVWQSIDFDERSAFASAAICSRRSQSATPRLQMTSLEIRVIQYCSYRHRLQTEAQIRIRIRCTLQEQWRANLNSNLSLKSQIMSRAGMSTRRKVTRPRRDRDGQPSRPRRYVPFFQTLKTETRPRRWTLKTETRPRRSIFPNSRDRDETETFNLQDRDETRRSKKRLETVSRPRRSRPRLHPCCPPSWISR